MANRVSGRFAPAPPPHVDLPSLPHPQVVDASGFELTDEELLGFAGEVIRASTTEPVTVKDAGKEGEEDGSAEQEMEVEGDGDGDQEPMEVDVEATEGTEPQEPSKQPLLDLAER